MDVPSGVESGASLWWEHVVGGQQSSWLTYHIPGAGPGALHCSLINGLGFEARRGWADSFGHDMLKGQRTIP